MEIIHQFYKHKPAVHPAGFFEHSPPKKFLGIL